MDTKILRKNPKKTIELLQEHLYPKRLRSTLAKAIEYDEKLGIDVKLYVKRLCSEALASEQFIQNTRMTSRENTNHPKYRKTIRESPSMKRKQMDRRLDHRPSKQQKLPPLCLHEECAKKGRRHYMRDCKEVTLEEGRRLIMEYKAKNGSAKKISALSTAADADSTKINALFAVLESHVLCADNGSDINLIPSNLLSSLLRKGAMIEVKTLKTPRRYGLAAVTSADGRELFLECDKVAVMNIKLLIRHGTTLTLRNVPWYVATGYVAEPLLGRPILEELGLNTREMLAAASDRFNGAADVRHLLPMHDYKEGSIARLIQDGIFHSDHGFTNEDGEEEDKSWLDLGEDSELEIRQAFGKILRASSENGLSAKGQKRLSKVLNEYRDVFRLRLGCDPPAKVEPMKIVLTSGAMPVRAKTRRYTLEQRAFLSRYVKKLEEYGFVESNKNATWVAAPVLVAKPPPANYRLTIDLRPVNAATVPLTWPMPHIESELADLAGSKFFATIDFCSGYWQLPLHEQSQHLHSFVTPNGVY